MYIVAVDEHADNRVYHMSDGCAIYVSDSIIREIDGPPSNVDYYFSERGYACESEREAVLVFHTQEIESRG